MDFLEYSNKAIVTAAKLEWEDRIINAAMGLGGETGEVLDHIKKFQFQGHDLDREYLALELGDILWYVNLLADSLGYDLEEIAVANITKLYKRFKNGQFSTDQSINRI